MLAAWLRECYIHNYLQPKEPHSICRLWRGRIGKHLFFKNAELTHLGLASSCRNLLCFVLRCEQEGRDGSKGCSRLPISGACLDWSMSVLREAPSLHCGWLRVGSCSMKPCASLLASLSSSSFSLSWISQREDSTMAKANLPHAIERAIRELIHGVVLVSHCRGSSLVEQLPAS